MKMNRGVKGSFQRLVLAIALPLVLLALAEAFLRVADIGFPTPFLIPSRIDGREVAVDNQFFGYRFFPERTARTPAAMVLDRRKPANTFRVFVLGGSAAMGDPREDFGLARHLATVLRASCPGRRIEVVNAAMTAINSHVVVEIARDVSAFEPDAFVIYMGNNEVVGPFGPGTVFESFSRARWLTAWRVKASRLRLAWLVRRLLRPAILRAGEPESWQGMAVFAERIVAADDPRLSSVYEQFEANVEELVAIGRRAGAAVILSTVAVNLRDCSPFVSAAAPGRGNAAEAFAAARQIESEGRSAVALRAYEEARDLDQLRFRADSHINGIIRRVAGRNAAVVRFVDAEAVFGAATTNAAVGLDYFLDHVHFGFEGNYLLASVVGFELQHLPALMDSTVGGRNLNVNDLAMELMYTPWDDLDLTTDLIARFRLAPFIGQPENRQRIVDLVEKQSRLREVIRGTDFGAVATRCNALMRSRPSDWQFRKNWGTILHAADLYEQSAAVLDSALSFVPHRYDLRASLAEVLAFEGRAEEGVRVLVRPGDGKGRRLCAQLLLRSASTLAEHGRDREALVFLEEAHRLDRGNAKIETQIAARHVSLGQVQDAENVLRNVLRRSPHHVAAQTDLAIILTVAGRWAEAEPLFLQAIKDSSGDPYPKLNYAMALTHRRDNAGALAQFDGLLQERPDYFAAAFHRGLLHLREGDTNAATRDFESVVSVAPDFAGAYLELARIAEARGDVERQRDWLKQADRVAPGSRP